MTTIFSNTKRYNLINAVHLIAKRFDNDNTIIEIYVDDDFNQRISVENKKNACFFALAFSKVSSEYTFKKYVSKSVSDLVGGFVDKNGVMHPFFVKGFLYGDDDILSTVISFFDSISHRAEEKRIYG